MANLQVTVLQVARRGAKTPNQPAVIALVSDEQGKPTKATRCRIMPRGNKKNRKHLRIAKATAVVAEAIKASRRSQHPGVQQPAQRGEPQRQRHLRRRRGTGRAWPRGLPPRQGISATLD